PTLSARILFELSMACLRDLRKQSNDGVRLMCSEEFPLPAFGTAQQPRTKREARCGFRRDRTAAVTIGPTVSCPVLLFTLNKRRIRLPNQVAFCGAAGIGYRRTFPSVPRNVSAALAMNGAGRNAAQDGFHGHGTREAGRHRK